MAYLGKYIRQMLTNKEEVTLPGFGSLVARKGKGAGESDGTIEPPGTIIAFNPEHPKDDGKLAALYASEENLDPEEARQQVLELVDAIKFKLDKGEPYVLNMVGEFSRDQDHRVLFRMDPDWVIDPELFGLSTLELLELEEEEEAEEAETEPKASAGIAEERFPTRSPKTVQPMKSKKRSAPSRAPVNKWRIIWIVVGSLIAVLVLLLLLPGNQNMEFGRDGIIFKDNESIVVPEDPLLDGNRDETKMEQHVAGEDSDPQTAEPETDLPGQEATPQVENRYFIIAGSFQGIPNATELQEKLKSAGFPAQIIITENRMYRVAVTSYSTKQAAVDDLSRIRSETGLPDCWVMIR